MKKLLPGLAAVLFALPARTSRAEAEQPVSPPTQEAFGNARNVVIGGDFSFSFQRARLSDDSSLTSVGVHPSLDYFLIDHLSVGTAVGISRDKWTWFGTEGGQTQLSVSPRVGYEVPLGQAFSLWPMVGISYFHMVGDGGGFPQDHQWTLDGYIRAPLLAHVAKHFFVGGGPAAHVNFGHSAAVLDGPSIGFESALGGWL